MPAAPLILASASSVRAGLLTAAGFRFTVEPAAFDERGFERDGDLGQVPADQVAALLAGEKARLVSGRHPGALVIGADQTLDCAGRRFDKPTTRAEAHCQLAFLAGRTHRLSSAAALVSGGEVLWQHVAEAQLTMRPLDGAEIERYLDRVGPAAFGSVGAYQLEGYGVRLFSAISGDYFTVLGLPLLPLLHELERRGHAL